MAKILCIEDDAELLEILSEELADAGHDVLQADDGGVGLEMIVEHKPDMVVSDISMPTMNGYVLLKTLREKHAEFADMPFLFLSALADRDHIIDGLDIGADDYLTKPIDYDMLSARIDAQLRQADRMQKKKDKDTAELVRSMENVAKRPADTSTCDVAWK